MNPEVRAHLFDNAIVVCFVAINLRLNISILYWAQNTLLVREINQKKRFNYIQLTILMNLLVCRIF